ncbi:MAG: hypothetical protein K0R66_949 [Gammaproteobacteria bacterium]|jgi:hypothetical protein|nr:hypothetical protein [Gammaproteobacteria bacterium]
MMPTVESLKAIGIDVWLPISATEKTYGLISALESKPYLVLVAAEDYEEWQAVQEQLFNILKWLKLDSESYCVGFLNDSNPAETYSLQELLEKVRPKQVISFGVPIRSELDSRSEIRYVETLNLTRVLNNVENKRRVMNDFAGFSL